MPQTSISLEPELLEFVKDTARRECRSVSGQIEYWISQHRVGVATEQQQSEAQAEQAAIKE